MIEKRVITEETKKQFEEIARKGNERVLKSIKRTLSSQQKEILAHLEQLSTEIKSI